jgi:hypothetical protein
MCGALAAASVASTRRGGLVKIDSPLTDQPLDAVGEASPLCLAAVVVLLGVVVVAVAVMTVPRCRPRSRPG